MIKIEKYVHMALVDEVEKTMKQNRLFKKKY